MPPQDGSTGWVRNATDFLWGSITSLGKGGGKEGNDATRDPECHNPDLKSTEDLSTNKRRLAKEETAPRKRPKIERSDLPDCGGPSNGTPIGYPAEYLSREQRSTAASNMSRPKLGGGNHRPLNTLNDSTLKRPATNAYPRSDGDAFIARERSMPPTKKPRIEKASPHEYANDPITDDADPSRPRVTGVNGKKVDPARENARRQQMGQCNSRKAPFEGQEHKSLDHLTQISTMKARRKPADGSRSSNPSSRTSSVNVTDDGAGQTRGNAVIVLDDTSQELSQSRVQGPASPRGSALPDVNGLTNGVEESSMRARRESDNSIQFVQTHARPSVARSSRATDHTRFPGQKQQQTPNSKRRTIKQDDGDRWPDTPRPDACYPNSGVTEISMQEKQRRPSDSGDTRNKFQRDEGGALPSAPGISRRKDAMKADSGRASAHDSAARESLGSADELAGPTTVRSVSPEKAQTHQRATASASRSSRSTSPSQLKHTQLASSTRPDASRRRIKTNARITIDDDVDGRTVPLQAFFATSRVLLDQNITMVYDNRENELTVKVDDMPVAVPDGQCTVHISSTEATTVFHSEESPLVVLRGSHGAVSKGTICIAFRDLEGKDWFSKRLTLVCNLAPKWNGKPADEMKRIFENQSTHVCQGHKKHMEIVKRERALREGVQAKEARRAKTTDSGAIRYDAADDDEEVAKPRRRRDIFGRNIEDSTEDTARPRKAPSASLERSHYFDDEPRRSTRQTKVVKERPPSPPPPEKWTAVNKPSRWAHSVVYPNQGARRVTVDFQDLERLDEGEFLNDNLISFALRRIEEQMPPAQRERVHFFNSFFYTALTTRNGRKAFNYDAVKRWTKSKDLLGCDYVVVPINIDMHWFVAIICNLPNLSRRPAALPDQETDEEAGEIPDAHVHAELPSDTVERSSAQPAEELSAGEATGMRNLSLSDEDGPSRTMPGNQEQATGQRNPEQHDSQSDAKKSAGPTSGRKKAKRGPPAYSPDKPAIITLDSFGAPHTGEIRNLKDYLKAEAEAKRGTAVDTGEIQGMNAKNSGIPTQTNFCDCGVYLVGYVEQFAKNPRKFAEKAMQRTLGQEGEFAEFDPSQKRDQIRSELLGLQKEQEAEHKAKKAGKKASAPKAERPATQSAAVSPKPESRPASKAASRIRGNETSNATSREQKLPPEVAPPKPRNGPQSTTQEQVSQDKELEIEAPRALGSSTRTAGDDQQPSSQPHLSAEEEEMLDDPTRGTEAMQRPAKGTPPPNPMLDDLELQLKRSHQSQLDRWEQQRLAEEKARETPAREPSYNGTEEELAAEEGGPGEIGAADVIDLDGNEDDSAEIPDSQEQSQRLTGGTQWAGKRITFA